MSKNNCLNAIGIYALLQSQAVWILLSKGATHRGNSWRHAWPRRRLPVTAQNLRSAKHKVQQLSGRRAGEQCCNFVWCSDTVAEEYRRVEYFACLACETARNAKIWSAAPEQDIGSLEISVKQAGRVEVAHASSYVYEAFYQSHLPHDRCKFKPKVSLHITYMFFRTKNSS